MSKKVHLSKLQNWWIFQNCKIVGYFKNTKLVERSKDKIGGDVKIQNWWRCRKYKIGGDVKNTKLVEMSEYKIGGDVQKSTDVKITKLMDVFQKYRIVGNVKITVIV